jgi:hypothetical protein
LLVQSAGRVGAVVTFLAVAVSGMAAVGAILMVSPVGAVAVSPLWRIR